MSNNTEVNKLSEVEKEELKDITKAYTDEELNVIIKVIPDNFLWDELMRREGTMVKGASAVCEIVGASFDSLQPIPARAWKEIRNRYDDLREKYTKLRKVLANNK